MSLPDRHPSDSAARPYARWYRDWTCCGLLACAVAGFPDTPAGPLLLWAVLLPLLASLSLRWHRRPRRRPRPNTLNPLGSPQGTRGPWRRRRERSTSPAPLVLALRATTRPRS